MGILADIARYHLLVAVQRWAGPMLAILCAHEGLRAGAQALPQPQFRASWAPPLTEERDATLRIRLAAMKVIAQAVKPELLELVRKVEEHRITVPAAERRLLAMLPPAEDLAQDVLARLVEKVEAAKAEEVEADHCNKYKHIGGKHCRFGKGWQNDNRHAREGKTKPQRDFEEKKPKVFNFQKPTKSKGEAKNHLERIKLQTTVVKNSKSKGIFGRGAKAPGEDQPEFFLTGKSLRELTCDNKWRKSADFESHMTAAAHVCELWRHSKPIGAGKHRDKYLPYSKSKIEWVHRRMAYMRIGKKRYTVKITAKEYKKGIQGTPHILYCVQTRLKK